MRFFSIISLLSRKNRIEKLVTTPDWIVEPHEGVVRVDENLFQMHVQSDLSLLLLSILTRFRGRLDLKVR